MPVLAWYCRYLCVSPESKHTANPGMVKNFVFAGKIARADTDMDRNRHTECSIWTFLVINIAGNCRLFEGAHGKVVQPLT